MKYEELPDHVRNRMVIIAGNLVHAELVEEKIMDGRLEEAMQRLEKLQECNMATVMLIAKEIGVDPMELFTSVVDANFPDKT